MAIKISAEQFEELNNNLIVDENGHTNKKCPICHNDIVIESTNNCYTIKCVAKNCLSIDCRGL
jgi:hypothetical protein